MRNLALALSLLALSACATVVGGREQEITVNTQPVGASCLLTNDIGQWTVDSTPAMVVVQRSFQPLTVTCTRPGLLPETRVIEGGTRPMSYGNILMLGVPVLVDAQTGAGYEYSPSTVNIEFGLVTVPSN